jgi:hypothetical protein
LPVTEAIQITDYALEEFLVQNGHTVQPNGLHVTMTNFQACNKYPATVDLNADFYWDPAYGGVAHHETHQFSSYNGFSNRIGVLDQWNTVS